MRAKSKKRMRNYGAPCQAIKEVSANAVGSSIFSRNWPQLGAARVEQASFFGFCLFGVVRLARAQGVDYDAEQRKAPTPVLGIVTKTSSPPSQSPDLQAVYSLD